MNILQDYIFIFRWWGVFLIIGIIFSPLTSVLFKNFKDKGYIFAKIIGIIIVSYAVFFLGTLKILPFTISTILLIAGFFAVINILILKKYWKSTIEQPASPQGGFNNRTIAIFLFEEIIFLAALFFWSYIRGFAPDIHGLEKYMDFGFVNSILRADFFPPKDMWFTPFSINYYYFGHLITAVLTKLSGLDSAITYNLMLATLFAFTFTGAFSIGANLFKNKRGVVRVEGLPTAHMRSQQSKTSGALAGGKPATGPRAPTIIAGLLTAFLVSLAGNLHTIYAFFKPYINENPLPLWQLAFSPNTFPNSYWYPNATRFIYNTIHEFPIYSFVVSDLHGHVLNIPVVLLTIALLLSLISKSEIRNPKQSQNSNFKNSKPFGILDFGHWKLFRNSKLEIRNLLLISFLLAIMYMTNVWDGIIYLLLAVLIFGFLFLRKSSTSSQPEFEIANSKFKKYILNFKCKFAVYNLLFNIFIVGLGFIIFSLPFNLNFKPFVSGIGVLCAPEFLTKIGKLGPFLFEVDHCHRSPLWQLITLYGFFYFFVVSFLIFLRKTIKQFSNLTIPDVFVLILILLSTILIIIPEFFYIKDIYPAHYRANTMFKLVYQAFILLSISSGYILVRLFVNLKSSIINRKSYWKLVVLVCIGSIGLFIVGIYPYFAINSYYGNLQKYYGLDGLSYLKNLYPTDYEAILWLNKNVRGQPVVLEAQGDSYTDYARVSANTGLPTVLGWTVHEWLWRGTYDVPAPRISDVQTLYETEDLIATKRLISKYQIAYVFVGALERQKYPKLNEEKLKILGKIIYQNGQTKIYKINQ